MAQKDGAATEPTTGTNTAATEHSHAMEFFGTRAADQSHAGGAFIPIVEVAFAHDKWWSVPEDMSRGLCDQMLQGQDACYTWDWGEGNRNGSWKPDGEETHINRYVIDFVNMIQTNIDNNRKRSVRIVWLRPEDVKARFTGQIL